MQLKPQLSKKFVEHKQKGNIDSAIKLVINNIVPLTDTTLKLLKQKHPKSVPTTEEIILPDQPESTHQIIHKNINVDAFRKVALKTKGGSRPYRMNADGWKRILTSKQFAESSTDLSTAIANMKKELSIKKDPANTLEDFQSCCLISLHKNPGL